MDPSDEFPTQPRSKRKAKVDMMEIGDTLVRVSPRTSGRIVNNDQESTDNNRFPSPWERSPFTCSTRGFVSTREGHDESP